MWLLGSVRAILGQLRIFTEININSSLLSLFQSEEPEKNRTISPLTTISWIICFVLFLEAGSCSSLRPLTLFNVANCWKPGERKAIGHPPLGLVICVIQIVNLFVFWINNDNYEKLITIFRVCCSHQYTPG